MSDRSGFVLRQFHSRRCAAIPGTRCRTISYMRENSCWPSSQIAKWRPLIHTVSSLWMASMDRSLIRTVWHTAGWTVLRSHLLPPPPPLSTLGEEAEAIGNIDIACKYSPCGMTHGNLVNLELLDDRSCTGGRFRLDKTYVINREPGSLSANKDRRLTLSVPGGNSLVRGFVITLRERTRCPDQIHTVMDRLNLTRFVVKCKVGNEIFCRGEGRGDLDIAKGHETVENKDQENKSTM
ncbi:hypothetical protein F4823DRAFT_471440 [Ustulina deusta]|nr:hypothetical protein F4823DRAFT_471440 [Ustulina deusta]